MQQPDISQVEQHVRRYWYTDGIVELVGGVTCILLGLYFGLQEYLGADSLLTTLLQASMVLLFIGAAFAARWLVNALKTRLTYPRTGYVEYRPPEKRSRVRGIVIAVAGMALAVGAILIGRLLGAPDLLVAMTGILLGIIVGVVGGRSSGSARFYVLGGISFVLGVALSYAAMPQGYALACYYGLMGLASVVSGSIVLSRYLRQNPSPAEAGNE